MDVREVLRHLQTTTNLSAIQRATGLNRRTLMRYRAWATEQGLLAGPLPPLEELRRLAARTLTPPAPPQTVSTVEPYRDLVLELHARGVEGTAIWQRLGERGYAGSLSSLYRFLHQVNPPAPAVTVRVERGPGTEAQVDFGYAGYLLDDTTGQRRKAWAFVMTLAYSRHQYVAFVHDQTLPTWIALHRQAFAFFGGVPQRIVLDNLKAGIARACVDDPQIQTTYRECAEHYGFLLAPCAPRTPEHKGKVEQGGVHYVKRNFLGGRAPTTLRQANADVRVWCQTTAGRRRHGTTKEAPLDRFAAVEQAQLLPLPATPYDLAIWKQVTLHRDCHVVFEQAFYSAHSGWSGNASGCGVAAKRSGCTPPTISSSPPTRAPSARAPGRPIRTTCRRTSSRSCCGPASCARAWRPRSGRRPPPSCSSSSPTRSSTATAGSCASCACGRRPATRGSRRPARGRCATTT